MDSRIKITISILVLFAVVSCGSPAPTEIPGTAQPGNLSFDPGLPAEFKPGDSLHISGTGTRESEPFTLPQDGLLRVTWDQTAGEGFTLIIKSTTEENDRVQFALQTAPGGGSGDYIFKSGDYVVVTQGENAQWKVTIEFVDYMEVPQFDTCTTCG